MTDVNIRELRNRPKYQTDRHKAMSDEEFASRYTAAVSKLGIKINVTGVNDPEAPETNVFDDLTKAIGSGANSALAGVIGLPGALTNTVEWAADKVGMGSRNEDERAFGFPEARDAINQVRSKLPPFIAGTDPNYNPQTRGGRWLKTGAELAASGGAGGARKLASQVIAPTVLSEGGGELAEGTALEGPVRIAGTMLGGKAVDWTENYLSGGKVDPTRLKASQTLEDAGVELTAGQVGGGSLAFAEEQTRAGRGKRQAAFDQFGDAAINRAIPPILKSTVKFEPGMLPQEKLAAFRSAVTGTMDDLAARNSMPVTSELFDDIFKIAEDYSGKLSTAQKSPYFEKLAEDLVDRAGGGQLSGQDFQNIRSALSSLTLSDGVTKEAAIAAKNALEKAMEISLAKKGNKTDMALYNAVRQGYRDLSILEAAIKKTDDAEFGITPKKLSTAAKTKEGLDYVYGKDTFSDLYRAGNSVLTGEGKNPSGTAGSLKAMMGYAPPLIGGAAATQMSGIHPAAAVIGLAALPGARNRALQSGPLQSYFKSTMRPGMPTPHSPAGILVGLQELQRQGQQQ